MKNVSGQLTNGFGDWGTTEGDGEHLVSGSDGDNDDGARTGGETGKEVSREGDKGESRGAPTGVAGLDDGDDGCEESGRQAVSGAPGGGFLGGSSGEGGVQYKEDGNDVAIKEMLLLQVRHLVKLCATTLLLVCDGEKIAFTTSRRFYDEAQERGMVCFVASEFVNLAHAAQNDRVWRAEFRRFVEKKREFAPWRLVHMVAMSGKIFDAQELSWTFGELFERIGVKLVGVV